MAGVYGSLNSRADFYRVLDATLAKSQDALAQAPDSAPMEAIVQQLEAVKAWTTDGREPRDDEQIRVNFGTIVAREYGDADDADTMQWADKLYALHAYFQGWPSDAEAADPGPDSALMLLDRKAAREERVRSRQAARG